MVRPIAGTLAREYQENGRKMITRQVVATRTFRSVLDEYMSVGIGIDFMTVSDSFFFLSRI